MGKHVIFLGAGASRSSGYPIANELRLLLSSESHFLSWVGKCFPNGATQATSLASEQFKHFQSSVELFRKGGFASVDEFCRSVSDQRKTDGGEAKLVHVENMRWLTRAVLGALNPENNFEDSEYYPFIQKLFKSDSLATLRDDLSILSFNYDPYLEFLLLQAWSARNCGLLDGPAVSNSITGGFFNPQDISWTQSDQPRLRLLKLHGSICAYPQSPRIITPDLLFGGSLVPKMTALFPPIERRQVPPVIFPWEMLNEDLKFRENDFPNLGGQSYRTLFQNIWELARKEVQAADKVSFVGLSMHEYLRLGFRYLFQGKVGPVQVVVANTLNDRFREGYRSRNPLHPNSPCRRAFELIKDATGGDVICEYSHRESICVDGLQDNHDQCVTARYSFQEFIEFEL